MPSIRQVRNVVFAARSRGRRGAALILTVLLMFTLLGFLAFSVDVGYLAGARAEMRRTADAAALAGGWELFNQLQNGTDTTASRAAARLTAAQYVAANRVANSQMSVDSGTLSPDLQFGYMSSLLSTAPLTQNASLPFMAVRVSVQKNAQSNGEVPFFFGKIFGDSGQDMTSSATSALAQSVNGFALPAGGNATLQLLPFALDESTWDALQSGCGSDNYRYDASLQKVVTGSDGKREMNLYPQGTGSPGNRGTVDIGSSNNSTADIARQIVYGVSSADLAALGKPLQLDSYGTMTLNGDTGISAGVKDELASIIGQTRVIPIFRSVCGNGNNAQYTIVKWAGIRILAVKLTGAMNSKYVMIQPAPLVCRNVTVGQSTSASSGIYSPVVLAQ